MSSCYRRETVDGDIVDFDDNGFRERAGNCMAIGQYTHQFSALRFLVLSRVRVPIVPGCFKSGNE